MRDGSPLLKQMNELINERQRDVQTNDKRQTNLQTQARQLNKQMVESAGRRSLPK